MLKSGSPCYITLKMEFNMSEQKPKLGKKGALREITKELSELRKKPISQKVHDIVRENFERNQRNNKKSANPSSDVEV